MPTQDFIELERVTKTYVMGTNEVHALNDVCLTLHRGEFITVVGPSGSGKSTLMHILGCLDRPTRGAYRLPGRDIATADDTTLSALRNRHIGFVFQQFNLLHNLTVQENIALPLAYAGWARDARMERARKVAAEVGLTERLHHRPYELSGGQAQRVAIARALICEPDLILADEPTGALDSQTGREIMGLLQHLNEQGTTLLVVTHDRDIAALGTRTLALADGKIVDDQTRRPAPTASPRTGLHAPPDQAAGVHVTDLLRIGIREGLLAHKLRTALTMLGVVIGVASVIGMSSMSEGSKKKQADQIRAMGVNLVRVVDQRLENQELHEARIAGSRGLTRTDASLLRRHVNGIAALATVREIRIRAAQGPRSLNARVLGVEGDYRRVNNLATDRGRYFDKADEETMRRVAVVGSRVAEQLGSGNAVGSRIELGGQPYTVIGVLADKFIDTTELEASGANDTNFDILIPLGTLMNRMTFLPLRNELDEIQVQLRNEDQLARAGNDIRRVVRAAHRGIEDFQLVIPLDLLKTRQQSQRLLDILSLLISAISLIVGGIGIMNIMLASVTERLREIGVRRAVGATARDIQRQFLVEAVIIAGIGGFIGVLLAVLIVLILCVPMQLPIVFRPGVMLIAVGASFITGMVFGYYPAARAASQNLVDVLQYE